MVRIETLSGDRRRGHPTAFMTFIDERGHRSHVIASHSCRVYLHLWFSTTFARLLATAERMMTTREITSNCRRVISANVDRRTWLVRMTSVRANVKR